MTTEEVSNAEVASIVDHEDVLDSAYPPEIAVQINGREENEENAEAAMALGSSLFLKVTDTPHPLEGKVSISETILQWMVEFRLTTEGKTTMRGR